MVCPAADHVITPETVYERMEDDMATADLVLWVGISFQQSASTQYFRNVRAPSPSPHVHVSAVGVVPPLRSGVHKTGNAFCLMLAFGAALSADTMLGRQQKLH